jgi:hypothetical protein
MSHMAVKVYPSSDASIKRSYDHRNHGLGNLQDAAPTLVPLLLLLFWIAN